MWLLCNVVLAHLHAKYNLHRIAVAGDPIEDYVNTYSFQIFGYCWIYGVPMLILLLVSIGVFVRLTTSLASDSHSSS